MVSRAGLAPLVAPQDTPGPMTRKVVDAALMLDVIAGFDEKDPYTMAAVVAGKPRGGSYAANLNRNSMQRAKLGVLRSVFGAESTPEYKEVNEVIRRALDILRKRGTTVIDIEIAGLDGLIAASSLYDIRSRSDLDRFLATKRPGLTCHQMLIDRQYRPSCDLFEDLARGPEDPTQDLRYASRIEAQLEFQRAAMQTIETHQLDAIVFPDAKIAAPLTSDVLEGRWPALQFPINTLIASQARLPAVTVPVGLTEGGLPVGLELVGLLYREQHLLDLAYGVEAFVEFNGAPNFGEESQKVEQGSKKKCRTTWRNSWKHWWKRLGKNQRKD
ncbi:amidase signature domain-containing protein [Aspergillus californicus]